MSALVWRRRAEGKPNFLGWFITIVELKWRVAEVVHFGGSQPATLVVLARRGGGA